MVTRLKDGKLNKGVIGMNEHQKKIREITRYLEKKGYSSVEFDMDLAEIGSDDRHYYFYATPDHDPNFKWHIVIKDTGKGEEGFEITPKMREPRRYGFY